MRAVISQSMYFPWIGMLEQIRLADVFVHYDDVQYARGFLNRVQIKSPTGVRWLTIPLQHMHRGRRIDEAVPDDSRPWRQEHRRLLVDSYRDSPYFDDVLGLYDDVAAIPARTLPAITQASMRVLADYFGIGNACSFVQSSDLNVDGSSTERLIGLCQAVDAQTYVTGHGARNYLDHALFDAAGISVQYMNYRCEPYPQLHGEFTPFISALDLVANCGQAGQKVIRSGAIPWKEFLHASK